MLREKKLITMLTWSCSILYAQIPDIAEIENCSILNSITTSITVQKLIKEYLGDFWTYAADYSLQLDNDNYSFGSDDHVRLTWSPDSQQIVCASAITKRILALHLYTSITTHIPCSFERENSTPKPDETFAIQYLPSGELIATEAHDERISVLDIQTNECRSLNPEKNKLSIYTVAIEPMGGLIAGAAYDPTKQKTVISLWHLKMQKILTTLYSDSRNKPQIRFSPNGKYMVCIGSRSAPIIEIWDLRKIENVPYLTINEAGSLGIIDFQFSSNNIHMVYGLIKTSSSPDKIICWNLELKTREETVIPKPRSILDYGLACLALSPDNKFYVFGKNQLKRQSDTFPCNMNVALIDDLSFSLETPLDYTIDQLSFSPDGISLALLSKKQKKLYIWRNSCHTLSMAAIIRESKQKSEIREPFIIKLIPPSA
jgi:WD40 repeat protein